MVYHWPRRRIASWPLQRTISRRIAAGRYPRHRNMARLHRLLWFIDYWIFLPDWCNHRWCRFVCRTTIADGAERHCRNLLQNAIRWFVCVYQQSGNGCAVCIHHRIRSGITNRQREHWENSSLLHCWWTGWWCDGIAAIWCAWTADYPPSAPRPRVRRIFKRQWSAMVCVENRPVWRCVPRYRLHLWRQSDNVRR